MMWSPGHPFLVATQRNFTNKSYILLAVSTPKLQTSEERQESGVENDDDINNKRHITAGHIIKEYKTGASPERTKNDMMDPESAEEEAIPSISERKRIL